ncbi:response regulator [Pseudanabaena sp. PCC 6802]|uniref:response regulator n=1 Tax=Pseudanabaena sp. PCC 6802 TaxID=118173 RepID=UPI000347DADD|nr:response regulator [Pseudanabaena sp. PCC 6802]
MPTPEPSSKQLPTLLVVEDAPDNLALIEQIFDGSDYIIQSAHDGMAAMAWLEQNMPDLILLDLSLPAMDGWEVARRLKADDRTKDIPIVAITANAMLGDKEAAIAAGCDDYLPKPLDIEQLENRVTYWLSRSSDLNKAR